MRLAEASNLLVPQFLRLVERFQETDSKKYVRSFVIIDVDSDARLHESIPQRKTWSNPKFNAVLALVEAR